MSLRLMIFTNEASFLIHQEHTDFTMKDMKIMKSTTKCANL